LRSSPAFQVHEVYFNIAPLPFGKTIFEASKNEVAAVSTKNSIEWLAQRYFDHRQLAANV